MKQNQKLSPKYWVIHDKTSDDILFWTASKSYQGAVEMWEMEQFEGLHHIGWFHEEGNEYLECILIEIKEVNL